MRGVLKYVLNKRSDDFGKQWAASLKTRIGIDLNEIQIEIFIKHEVKSKQFKVMLFSLGVKHTICSSYAISSKILHSWYNLILKVNLWRNMVIEIFLKLMV